MIKSDSLEEAPKRDFNNTTSFTPAIAHAYTRASGVFRFLPSPLHPWRIIN